MKHFVIVLFILFSKTILADSSCSFKGTKVIYTNGVFTGKQDAYAALEKIASLSLGGDDVSKIHGYELSYNNHEQGALDVIESVVQRLPTSFIGALTLRNKYAGFKYFFGKDGAILKSSVPDLFDEIINELISIQMNFQSSYLSNTKYTEDLLRLRDEKYFKHLNDGYRIIAISHSQGGLFMEDAYSGLEYSKKNSFFTGFQIASPVRFSVIDKMKWATHTKDRIIQKVNALVGTLEPNIQAPLIVDNTFSTAIDYVDIILNHGIVTTYLHDSSIKSELIQSSMKAVELLESNCPVADFDFSISGNEVFFEVKDSKELNLKGLVYEWDFGDGLVTRTTSKNIVHEFEESGEFSVKLRVTDENNRDFWDKSFVEKYVENEGAGGSFCNGEKGKFHLNPNGSVGGFVSQTSTVASTVYLTSSIQVCGRSQLLGSTVVDKIQYTPGYIMDEIRDVTIIDSAIQGYFNAWDGCLISRSKILDGVLCGESEIINTEVHGSISLYASKVSNSTLLSPIDEEYGGYKGGYSVQNSTLSGCTFNVTVAVGGVFQNIFLEGRSLDVVAFTLNPEISRVFKHGAKEGWQGPYGEFPW